MGDLYILDEQGAPLEVRDVAEWGEWFTRERRIVSQTQIGEKVLVSTVFLGMNHRFGEDGPPLLWETMIFGGPLNEAQERYASLPDARAGHKVMCRQARRANRTIGAWLANLVKRIKRWIA